MTINSFKDYLLQYEEASNLYNQVSGDVTNVEGTTIEGAAQGWQDLSDLSSYSDLLDNDNSGAQNWVTKVRGDAETYMQNTALEVAAPNNPGQYIPIYAGYLNGYDSQGNIIEVATGQGTLWEAITNPSSTFINEKFDAYFNNSGGPGPGLGTGWSENGSFSWETQQDGRGDNGQYAAAQGTLSQWEPYIHLAGGDTSALNGDLRG